MQVNSLSIISELSSTIKEKRGVRVYYSRFPRRHNGRRRFIRRWLASMVTSESWPARNWPRPFVINGLSLISEPAVKICRTNSTIWKGWRAEKRLVLQEEDSQPSFPWTRSIQPCSEFTPYSVVKRFRNRTVFRWNRSNRFSFGCPQESSRSLLVNPLHPWNGKRLLLFRRGLSLFDEEWRKRMRTLDTGNFVLGPRIRMEIPFAGLQKSS